MQLANGWYIWPKIFWSKRDSKLRHDYMYLPNYCCLFLCSLHFKILLKLIINFAMTHFRLNLKTRGKTTPAYNTPSPLLQQPPQPFTAVLLSPSIMLQFWAPGKISPFSNLISI